MEQKIKIGISSCLLGEKVRYDGGHKLDHYLKDTLGQFVEWTPVCPEVECGLSIPREAMHLAGTTEAPRLVTRKTGTDYTDRMQQWARGRLEELEKEDLCGFIFKSRSPSSGMRGVKVYNPSGVPSASGVGIFARAYIDHFPLMPVEDDGRLNDPDLRENFIERIFVYRRWKELTNQKGSNELPRSKLRGIEKRQGSYTPMQASRNSLIKDLISFHTEHKLLILSHSPKHYSALGKLVAEGRRHDLSRLHDEYLQLLMEGLRLLSTVKKNTNVLQHMMGYFKNKLTGDEKKELSEVIGNFHAGLIPLIVPITLFNHYVRIYDEPYLKRQHYLNPHPLELKLRNHV